MKTYKISQTIDKNIYPIESKIDELKDSNQKFLKQILSIYSPVFISAILTALFGGSIISADTGNNESNNILTFLESLLESWWGKAICIIIVFTIFVVVIFGICKLANLVASRTDNKGTSDKRTQIAKEFYKVLVPEIITGASLFERAYEIECYTTESSSDEEMEKNANLEAEKICLEELADDQSVIDKAILYYYEAFYHFKLVAQRFEELKLIEYKDSDRQSLNKLYEIIGKDALKKTVSLSQHCVKEVCKRICGVEEKEICDKFDDFVRKLK